MASRTRVKPAGLTYRASGEAFQNKVLQWNAWQRRMYFLFVFKYKYSTVPLFTYIMHFIYIVYISDIDNRWCDWLKYSPLLRQINKYTTFVTIRAKRGSAGLVVLLIVWLIAFFLNQDFAPYQFVFPMFVCFYMFVYYNFDGRILHFRY